MLQQCQTCTFAVCIGALILSCLKRWSMIPAATQMCPSAFSSQNDVHSTTSCQINTPSMQTSFNSINAVSYY